MHQSENRSIVLNLNRFKLILSVKIAKKKSTNFISTIKKKRN